MIVAGYVRASTKDMTPPPKSPPSSCSARACSRGLGQLRVSAVLTTVTVLLLAEKPRLHGFVARLDEPTMLAAARFAVMSVVILPLLPEGPMVRRPASVRASCGCSCSFSPGMSFVGYIAQRMSGASGYPLTGLVGGLVSSTSVTLTFARLSQAHPQQDGRTPRCRRGQHRAVPRVATAVAISMRPCCRSWRVISRRHSAAGLVALALAWRSLRGAKADPANVNNPLQLPSRDRDGPALPGRALCGLPPAPVGR